ncbi:hypothetical protein HDU67_005729 [Dinochytrium kinnereticum]|nr:hypothetical protein HDU67_005729 [Dinochytrium kinnereticum]
MQSTPCFVPDYSGTVAKLETALLEKDYGKVAALCEDLELDFSFADPTRPGPYDPPQPSSAAMETDEETSDPNDMAITAEHSPSSSSSLFSPPIRPHDPRIYCIELAALLIGQRLPEARAVTLRVDGFWPPSSTSPYLPSPLQVNGKGSPVHPSVSDYSAIREAASALHGLDFERAYRALREREGRWDPAVLGVSGDLWESVRRSARDLISAAFDSVPIDRVRRWVGFIHPDELPEQRPHLSSSLPVDPSTPSPAPASPAPVVETQTVDLTALLESTKSFCEASGWAVEPHVETDPVAPIGGMWVLPGASRTVAERSRKAFLERAEEARVFLERRVRGVEIGTTSGVVDEEVKHFELLTEFVMHLEKE